MQYEINVKHSKLMVLLNAQLYIVLQLPYRHEHSLLDIF